VAFLLALALGCAPARPALSVAAPRPAGAPFSGERAFTHLEALASLGPRPNGSPALDGARDYIRTTLEGLGIEVREERARNTSDSPDDESAPDSLGESAADSSSERGTDSSEATASTADSAQADEVEGATAAPPEDAEETAVQSPL
jgi:hypothetical protein